MDNADRIGRGHDDQRQCNFYGDPDNFRNKHFDRDECQLYLWHNINDYRGGIGRRSCGKPDERIYSMSGLGDYPVSTIVYGKFSTFRPSTGAAYTLGGTPALSVYKDNSTTQSTSGVTLTVDFDGVTGLHHFAIDTSADGSFYSTGSNFDIVITTGTVDSVSVVGAKVGSFSIDKANDVNLTTVAGTTQTAGDLATLIRGIGTASGAAINIDAAGDNYAGGITGVTSGTTKVGTQTNTYAVTSPLDGVYHVMTHSGDAIDIVYQFLTGGGTSPVSLTWNGYMTSANDTITFRAWDHVGGAWEIIGSQAGTGSTTNTVKNLILYSRHRGTSAAELGKVYIRLDCTAQSAPVLNTDQIYVSYAITSRSVGYANGAIWVDTTAGTAGTEAFVNGAADLPVLTWADALTLAAALNMHKFYITNDSAITLSAASAGYDINGAGSTLALGGQDITGSFFREFTAVTGTGTSTGTPAVFRSCLLGSVNLPTSFIELCALGATVTLGAAANYYFVDCFSAIPGAGTPTIDFNGVGGASVVFRRWSGGLTVINLTAGDVMSIDVVSGGTITVNGTGGSVVVRGICSVTDASGGLVTITQTSVLNQTVLATATNLTIVDTVVDAILVDTAEIGAAGAGLTALATQTSVNTIDDFLDTEIAAIKAKTDSLTFTVAGQVDSNIQYVNDVQIQGTGVESSDEWRPV